MKSIRYSITGLFIISVVFVAGNSFAQLIPYGSATAQRFDPFRAGMSPSDLELLRTWRVGPDPSATPLIPYESATVQRLDPFMAGMSPSDKELLKTWRVGTDRSAIPLAEYGESEPRKTTAIVFGKEVNR
jgi:hypothetical protein